MPCPFYDDVDDRVPNSTGANTTPYCPHLTTDCHHHLTAPDQATTDGDGTMMAVGSDPGMDAPPAADPSTDFPPGPPVTPEWLGMELADERETLVLDARSSNDFNVSHIQSSIHVTIPSLMLKRLKKGNLGIDSVIKCPRFQNGWRTAPIIIYDEDTSDIKDCPNALITLLYQRLSEQGSTVYFLQGGFKVFHDHFPELCSGQEADESTILGLRNLQITESQPPQEAPLSPNSSSPFPVEVLPYLFLGNAKNSADSGCLSRNGIKYVLNVTNNIPNTFEGSDDFRYMKIPINDHWSQNLAASFPDAIAFIDEAREKCCGVLVHCLAGISRSVTVTVAYLMFSRHLSLNDAYDVVKKCKPNISPNFNFMGQLLDFEQTLNISGIIRCTCASVAEDDSPPHITQRNHDNNQLRVCKCKKETKTFFSSPTCTSSSSVSSTSSMSSSSSLAMSSASSNTAFDYDIPPTPS